MRWKLVRSLLVAAAMLHPAYGQTSDSGPAAAQAETFQEFYHKELAKLKTQSERKELLIDILTRARSTLQVDLEKISATPEDVVAASRALQKTAAEGLKGRLKSTANPPRTPWAKAKDMYEAAKSAMKALLALKVTLDKMDALEPTEEAERIRATIEKRDRQIEDLSRQLRRLRETEDVIERVLDDDLRKSIIETDAALRRGQAETERIFAARTAAVKERAPGLAAEIASERERYLEMQEDILRQQMWKMISNPSYGPNAAITFGPGILGPGSSTTGGPIGGPGGDYACTLLNFCLTLP